MLKARAALLLLGVLVADVAWKRSFHEVAWPDECIYLVGARKLAERGDLNTNFYLTYSLLRLGYPHRDVHMPGYILALAPLVWMLGATLAAGAALNVALYLLAILLVHALARRLLADDAQALAVAVLFAILPPFPGYLYVVYPELLTACWLLAGLVWLYSGSGGRHAFVAGVLFGLGPLVRETLLLALPFYLARLPRRELLRGFLPGAVLALGLVVAPLSRDRALHPNAIYPGVLEEARRSPDPLGTLLEALGDNVRRNLSDAAEARPFESAEDAVLALLLGLSLVSLVSASGPSDELRRFARAALASLGLLSVAVLLLYVVRERGGVWGGVRVYMMLAPPLLVCASAPLLRAPPRPRAVSLLAAAALLLVLDARQLHFFLRYKSSNFEDQSRYARYVEGYVARGAPRRIVGRLFLYGLDDYPTEIVWQYPRDYAEFRALEKLLPFDYLVLNGANPLRLFVIRNPSYVRVNRDDRASELLIFQRLE